MRIAFFLENQDIPDVDLTQPEKGNPGCGGTEFLFVALPWYLQKLQGESIKPVIFANHTRLLPPELESHPVNNILEAAKSARQYNCKIFVYRPRRHEENGLHELIGALNLFTVAWLHVTPTNTHLRRLAKNPYIRAAVCVEHEQHELLRDTAVWHKLTYIVNGFDVDHFRISNPPEKDKNLVVYLGALVPQKGFHLLAQAWPKILKRCPDAKLAVIGSGALYNANAKLGSWGIAEQSYEEQYIKPYLSNIHNRPLSSVTFMGKLGTEKKELLYKAAVGVPNPSGQSENCPGSALEFQACSTPVVSGAFYGMLDTIRHNETGLLGNSIEDLVNNICCILENPDVAKRLGNNGIPFLEERYNFLSVTRKWKVLFEQISSGMPLTPVPYKTGFRKHHKWLVYFNRPFQRYLGKYIKWPSVLECKEQTMKIIRKFKK